MKGKRKKAKKRKKVLKRYGKTQKREISFFFGFRATCIVCSPSKDVIDKCNFAKFALLIAALVSLVKYVQFIAFAQQTDS